MKYKLTDSNGCTKNKTKWGPGVTHMATGNGTALCSDGFIHFYDDLLVGVFMNPIQGKFVNLRAFEGESIGEVVTEGTKSGAKGFTTLREVNVPQVSTTQRVAFGILCALEVSKSASFVTWAGKWLSGVDRSRDTAYATADAAYAYADADATYAYAAADADAANAANEAAYAAAAAAAAAAYSAVYAAADAVNAANDAAYAANDVIDFPSLAQKALTYN